MYFHYYHDQMNDPAINLAFEEILFEKIGPGNALLLIYRNSDCVVIGKNQNPWLEANIPWLEEKKIPLLRRISGGGTVWHDLGNLNYSFIGDPALLNKEENLAFLCRSLGQLGFELQANSRGDLLIGDLKCSGNALCYRKGMILHHGTLLFSANLEKLHNALDSSWRAAYEICASTVASVKSRVCQMQTAQVLVSIHQVVDTLLANWQAENQSIPYLDLPKISNLQNHELVDKYRDQLWNFGRTPEFQLIDGTDAIEFKQGKYQGISCSDYIRSKALS